MSFFLKCGTINYFMNRTKDLSLILLDYLVYGTLSVTWQSEKLLNRDFAYSIDFFLFQKWNTTRRVFNKQKQSIEIFLFYIKKKSNKICVFLEWNSTRRVFNNKNSQEIKWRFQIQLDDCLVFNPSINRE